MRVSALLISVTLLGVPALAGAQGVTAGAKAGISLATLAADGEDSPYGMRLGPVVGGFVTWPLSSRFEVQPEVVFSSKGAALDDEDAKIELDYLEVPLLASYRVAGDSLRGLKIFGGASVGFLLRGRTAVTFGDETISSDITDDAERFEMGAVGGAAYELGRWLVEGRYTLGLTNVDKTASDDEKVRTRTLSLLGGMRF